MMLLILLFSDEPRGWFLVLAVISYCFKMKKVDPNKSKSKKTVHFRTYPFNTVQ